MDVMWLWLGPFVGAVALLLLTCLVESLWKVRKFVAEVAAALLVVSMPFIFLLPFALWALVVLVFLHVWFVLIPARLIFGRLDALFLRSSTVLGVGLIMAAVGLILLGGYLELEQYAGVLAGAVGVVAIAIGATFVWQILWTYRHYRVPVLTTHIALKDLPTVSVCIPARNENQALADCITAALASNYPKLEVLVLDDCSQDDTSEVIRSFAHQGVRFVQGDTPAAGWLGRNLAMSTLAHHATGDYLLFVSVDTQLGPDSIGKLVSYAKGRADMVSVLPYNRQGIEASTMLTTLQYFWQVALPITKRRVPVSSKCWLITANALRKPGGFDAVKHKIVPEGSFARHLFADDSFRFVVSDYSLGITTAKTWLEQVQTSLRLLYPTLKRQPMYVLGGLLSLALFVAPFAAMAFLPKSATWLLWLFTVAAGLLVVAYVLVLLRTHPRTWLLGALLLPVVLVQEALLLVVSMLGYEFSEVNWKGRNVCYPVIRARRRQVALRPQTHPTESVH